MMKTTVLNEIIGKLIFESSALVFRTTLAEEITSQNEVIQNFKPYVVSMVSLAGEGGGNLSILCSSDTAMTLAAKMLGMSREELNSGDDMRDAMGELANMVAGNLKTKLAPALPGLVLSIPTVITGEDYHIKHLSNGPHINVPFLATNSPVLIQYVFSKQ